MTDHNRYLNIVRWADRRYRDAESGELVISRGTMVDQVGVQIPSRYAEIERMAWHRYCHGMQCDRGLVNN